jgi:hypothetical protein
MDMMTIERAKKFIEELDKNRVPIISPEILKYVDEIATDKERSIKFLQEGGFLDSNGELAAEYRPDAPLPSQKGAKKRRDKKS